MALIACKECGTEVSSKAETCPKCGVKIASNSMGCGTWVVVLIIGAVILSAITSNQSSDKRNVSSSPSSTATTIPVPVAKVPGSQWSYHKSEDPMAKGISYQATVQSSNTVNFDFPYAGPQHGTLILRTHPRYGKNILLSIEKGQFLCRSYEDCNVLVRFDDDAAVAFSGIGPSDNSSTTVFIRNYGRFVERMTKAKKVRIAAEIYQHGSPIFEFDVSDFDQNKYIPKK